LHAATKSILTTAEKRACAVTSGETLTQRKKVFVHSVLSQLTSAVYTTPASPLQQDGVAISVDVARAVYARISPILQRFYAPVISGILNAQGHSRLSTSKQNELSFY
uniref:Conserved oligomeric Golgi complex subunit 5 n=1 Tax=Hydatigena taeniaeformis TaxID=6205 RepID=A0A0R3WS98_HYDTA